MKRAFLVVAVWAAGCRPDLGNPPSLITGGRVLAIQSEPAEVKPGAMVALHALVVGPDGDAMAPDTSWNVCLDPKPLAENNVVGRDCLFTADGDVGQHGLDVVATAPTKACSLFGPDTPPMMPGMPPLRPRDADVTGGYYLPVRAVLTDPTDPSGNGVLAGIALTRLSCNLANAPADVSQDFKKRYTANQNPIITDVQLSIDGVMDLPDLTTPVPAGRRVFLQVGWTPDSAETYPVFDPATRTLVDHREAMRVSWYASAGEFDHDRTGRGETEQDDFAQNAWTAPDAPGVVHFWAVLRDSRGGMDFRGFDLTVQ